MVSLRVLWLSTLVGCSATVSPPPSTVVDVPFAAAMPSTPRVALAQAPSVPPGAARSRRSRATELSVQGDTLLLPGPVVFLAGSDKLSPGSDEVLEPVRDYLDAKPEDRKSVV